MKKTFLLTMAGLLICLLPLSTLARVPRYIQDKPGKTSASKPMLSLSGLRMGTTYIWSNSGPKGLAEQQVLKNENINFPMLTQFGWQFEKLFGGKPGDHAGVLSLVALAGGTNQGLIIPSLTGVIGFRLNNGLEFGGGPNLAATKDTTGKVCAETGFAWTLGYSARAGQLVLPVNLALVQSPTGARLTLLTGFKWNGIKTK